MGILEFPNNDAILNKLNNPPDGRWGFQIAVLPATHVSFTIDIDHFTVSGDKILVAVKTGSYTTETIH